MTTIPKAAPHKTAPLPAWRAISPMIVNRGLPSAGCLISCLARIASGMDRTWRFRSRFFTIERQEKLFQRWLTAQKINHAGAGYYLEQWFYRTLDLAIELLAGHLQILDARHF